MLVLSRKRNQGILIKGKEGDIRIVLLEADKGRVRLGIEAPRGCTVIREELIQEIQTANEQSVLRDINQIRTLLGEQGG